MTNKYYYLYGEGDSVLDGTSTLTLRASCLQHLTRLFQQYLHSRTNQHGFLALPSHPADTPSMLQVQFLFDMLQKTISLKLIHPLGSRLQSVVKIFPFKSLRYLELKRVPPHCLEGLRAIYSQLLVFICSKSLSSLEELLSLCGGPYYNSITCLDESLRLLNVLRSLDLSHKSKLPESSTVGVFLPLARNACFLLPLSDLQHLNLGYNFLQRVPLLGMSCRATLVKLVLRNNELETINGVEQLCSLQHLDLAYNLLMEHSQLVPLSLLHNLKMLNLEGNPLYFHKTHRLCTVRHVSPKAAFNKLRLDGCPLSSSELEILPRPGQLIVQAVQTTPQAAMATERGHHDGSSGAGEMSDSVYISELVVKQLHRKKSRSKVRVRRASISEPSDTDHELRNQASLQDIVLRHQKEIERMESFRDQLGEDWLRYQHHLERASPMDTTDHSGSVNGYGAPAPHQSTGPPSEASQPPHTESHTAPLLTSEPKEEGLEPEPNTESTLRWRGRSTENTESTLETSAGEPQDRSNETLAQEEEEEEDLGVDLCLPLLVGVLLEEEEEQGAKRARCPLFLRVKPGHALEVDMQSGRVLARLELDSLQKVSPCQAAWADKEEGHLPALELHFSYISRTRRRRCYVMLDDNPEEVRQALADILSRVVEENERRLSEGRQQSARLQCLRCCAEFAQQGAQGPVMLIPGGDAVGQEEESGQDTGGRSGLICPECGSDHVVQLAGQSAPSTSTPLQCSSEEDDGSQRFSFNGSGTRAHRPQDPAVGGAASVSGTPGRAADTTALEETALTATFLTARSGTFYIGNSDGSSFTERDPSQLLSFHTPDGPGKDELYTSYSYSASQPQPLHLEGSSPGQFDLLSEDFEAVDHRLKLFLDMEVFEDDSEELNCFFKMSTVKFGDPVEFPSLLVVSDQSIYILEITMETQGQPSDLLLKRHSHCISDLSYLELGLGSQSINMEFEDGGSAYTLLVRDSSRCKRVFGHLTGIVRELASKSNSKLKSISTTRLSPQHHLWPLLCNSVQADSVEDYRPEFLYLLAFTQRDDSLNPVTVLVTQETLHLLNEDHQWSKSLPDLTGSEGVPPFGGRVTIQETQPISYVSSVHLFACDPCRVNINIYDEMEKEERTWALLSGSAELAQALVDWVRTQWEAMFGVKLMTCLQEEGS
ncbi:hypothetical protein AAFF_G00325870 [Aldrovandia affinis]|uniref:Serine/threonine-protein kinase 11-interacting protein n=1 Tax=Aldrovandia affinis TaxID=143900 RepID=A0AAD7T966_9TELE|nr:hypothetical protein AAFF_G00325870 [Aldrovandia affinis]